MLYTWTAAVHSSYLGSLTAVQQAAVDEIKANLTAVTDKRQVVLEANVSLIGIPIQFTLTVKNFLNQTGSDSKTVTRVNVKIPHVYVGFLRRDHLIIEDLSINGKHVNFATTTSFNGSLLSFE